MALERVAIWRSGKGEPAFRIVVGGQEITLSHAQADTLSTESAVQAAIEQVAQTSKVELPRIFVHKNRDGTWALATGQEPDAWPEDEPAEDEDEIKR